MDGPRDTDTHGNCYMTTDSTVECSARRIRDGQYAGRVIVVTVTDTGHEERRVTFTKADPDAATALARARTWAHTRYPPAPGARGPGAPRH